MQPDLYSDASVPPTLRCPPSAPVTARPIRVGLAPAPHRPAFGSYGVFAVDGVQVFAGSAEHARRIVRGA